VEQAKISSLTDSGSAGAILNWKGSGPAPSISFPIFDRQGNQVLTVTGSSQVFLQRPATSQWPAGVYFRSRYLSGNDSYLEKSADALQFAP